MLSYGRGGEDDVTKRVQQLNNDKNIKMSDGKIPPDDDVINGKEEEKEVPVFKVNRHLQRVILIEDG